MVSTFYNETLRVWDVESGQTLCTLEGHTSEVIAVAVLDEKCVVSASDDQTLRVWDVESGETLAVFNLDVGASAVAITADGRTVIAGDQKGSVHFLDLDLEKRNAPSIVESPIELTFPESPTLSSPVSKLYCL